MLDPRDKSQTARHFVAFVGLIAGIVGTVFVYLFREPATSTNDAILLTIGSVLIGLSFSILATCYLARGVSRSFFRLDIFLPAIRKEQNSHPNRSGLIYRTARRLLPASVFSDRKQNTSSSLNCTFIVVCPFLCKSFQYFLSAISQLLGVRQSGRMRGKVAVRLGP